MAIENVTATPAHVGLSRYVLRHPVLPEPRLGTFRSLARLGPANATETLEQIAIRWIHPIA